MDKDALSDVAIVMTSPFRFFMWEMAKVMRAERRCRLHLYCNGPDHTEYFTKLNTDGLFDSVQDYWLFHKNFGEPVPNPAETFRIAREFERRYGTTINEAAMGSTNFGYQFALAGYYVQRTRLTEETSYAQMVNLYNKNFQFWEDEIKTKRLSLMVGGASIPNDVMIVAAAHRIPLRALTVSRFDNLHYWAHDRYFQAPEVEEAFRAISDPDPKITEKLNSYLLYHIGRNTFIADNTSLARLAKNVGMFAARHVYYRLRGKNKHRNLYMREMIGGYLRIRRDFQRILRMPLVRPNDLEGQDFVFFPLQVEPESSMGMMSPEFFSQQFAIATVARDLPAGVKLVVKEHYVACGRRPKNFYDQLQDMKNVVMADPRAQGLEFIRKARAVVTFSGTPGFEGAILGTPVITFCRHNQFNIVPHVRVIKDPGELTPIMRQIFDGSFDRPRAVADGARFLQAVVDTSFDLGTFNQVDARDIDLKVVEETYRELVKSLGVSRAPAAVAAQ